MLLDGLIVIESFAVVLIVRVAGDAAAPPWPYFWPFALFSALAFVLLLNLNGVYQSNAGQALEQGRVEGLYQDIRVLSATAIAAGGLFLAVFCVGPFGFGMTRVNLVPFSVVLVGSLFAYLQLACVRLLKAKRARGSRTVN